MRLIYIIIMMITCSFVAKAEEMPIEAVGPSGTLHGTYLKSEGHNSPVVLIIPGSGPTDRDGNNPMGVKAQPYRLLAQDLDGMNISSVRIDKRGMFENQSPDIDANKIIVEDYVSDIKAWTTSIKAETGNSCVWVAGHSEGGLIALASAQKNMDICGLILISAPGRKLSDVIRMQLKANPANAPILPPALVALDMLENGEHVDSSTLHPALKPLFNEAVQDFLISVFSYDPAELVKTYGGPTLVLQGTKDIQVTMEDAIRLSQARSDISLVKLEGVNHVLKFIEGNDVPSNMASYGNPNLPIAPNVGIAIKDFIAKSSH